MHWSAVLWGHYVVSGALADLVLVRSSHYEDVMCAATLCWFYEREGG